MNSFMRVTKVFKIVSRDRAGGGGGGGEVWLNTGGGAILTTRTIFEAKNSVL